MCIYIVNYLTIFHSGSMLIATSMNSLSRNGTLASSPHADVALFALKQSYWCRAFICKPIVSGKKNRTVNPKGKQFMNYEHLMTCFSMEFFLVRCLVKVEISSKNLIRTFTREDHFDSQSFDLASHEKHWSACSDCSNIISLNVMNHILNCINTVLLITE